jgi:hypothetical protein
MYPNPQTIKRITNIAVALCIFSLPLKYPSEIFPNRANASVIPAEQVDLLWWEIEEDMGSDEMPNNWKDIRKERLNRQIARGEAKTLFLCWGHIPFRNTIRKNKVSLERGMIQDKAGIWVRDADGRTSQAVFDPGKDGLSVNIPEDLELNGLYLIGAHLDIGEMDIDSDGETERVYRTAKRIISHSKTGGRQGNKRGTFFNAPDKFPLEIGCSDAWFRHDYQRAYREYEMKVIYQGKPLADTEVSIFSRSGWQKTVQTDSSGKFLITPFGNMGNNGQEKYLYMAAHHNLLKREYHSATLMMNVHTNPEWHSRSGGFMLWTILGTGMLVIIVTVGIYRKKKHAREAILKFENQRIKRN